MALLDFLFGETLKQAEMDLDEFLDGDDAGVVADDEFRAIHRATERRRKGVMEYGVAEARFDLASRRDHLRAAQLGECDVVAAVIADARLALGLAMTNENQRQIVRLMHERESVYIERIHEETGDELRIEVG